jgi:YidC/Oxa1 family membrane protein insertase
LLTLNLFFSFCKNYGLAIIFLTIALKLLTLPLSLKGMSSMKKMSTLQPKIAALKAQFKDNPSQLNLETAKLMKTEGYNPIAGCLPLLIQIPVFFALYRVLYTAVELYQAPFIFWIKDLSTPDPYYVLPALTAGAMFWQQKLSPNPGMDPAQAKVMQFMPLLFGLFSVTAPSGLAIYILVNTLATAVQTLFTNRKIPWVKFGLPKGYLEPKI